MDKYKSCTILTEKRNRSSCKKLTYSESGVENGNLLCRLAYKIPHKGSKNLDQGTELSTTGVVGRENYTRIV